MFNESLRFDAPLNLTSWVQFEQDVKCGWLNIKRGMQININVSKLHYNPAQWIRPEEYLPERFDPSSPLYLTPTGQKRDAMSYCAFNGGKRVCFGKLFAELVNRLLVINIFSNFDLEFVDAKWNDRQQFYNIES